MSSSEAEISPAGEGGKRGARRKGGSPARKGKGQDTPPPFKDTVAKWIGFALIGSTVAYFAIDFLVDVTATPEEKARWAEERAVREQERAEASAARERERAATQAARAQEREDAELRALATSLGFRYERSWGNSYQITASEIGDKWPFIHNSATVYCKMTSYGRPMVTVSFDGGGSFFGLNGVALGKERMQGTTDVRRRDPRYGVPYSVDSLIARATQNCAPS